jgi:hypothetical protein
MPYGYSKTGYAAAPVGPDVSPQTGGPEDQKMSNMFQQLFGGGGSVAKQANSAQPDSDASSVEQLDALLMQLGG